uniref:Uncharacterized protein n=1 Tax=Anopheles atroparvus TaxID=41427 RepID=A0AAG5CY73_ANOAO
MLHTEVDDDSLDREWDKSQRFETERHNHTNGGRHLTTFESNPSSQQNYPRCPAKPVPLTVNAVPQTAAVDVPVTIDAPARAKMARRKAAASKWVRHTGTILMLSEELIPLPLLSG